MSIESVGYRAGTDDGDGLRKCSFSIERAHIRRRDDAYQRGQREARAQPERYPARRQVVEYLARRTDRERNGRNQHEAQTEHPNQSRRLTTADGGREVSVVEEERREHGTDQRNVAATDRDCGVERRARAEQRIQQRTDISCEQKTNEIARRQEIARQRNEVALLQT